MEPMVIHALCRLQWNLRAATVVGAAGADGIGQAVVRCRAIILQAGSCVHQLGDRDAGRCGERLDARPAGMGGHKGKSPITKLANPTDERRCDNAGALMIVRPA